MPVPVPFSAANPTAPSIAVGEQNLRLRIVGLGRQDGPHLIGHADLADLARRNYPESPAMAKVLEIDKRTGVKHRTSVLEGTDSMMNGSEPPSSEDISRVFLRDGVALGVAAAHKALAEWGGELSEITHMVSVTTTNSANPGFDLYAVEQLGLNPHIERVLLHGIGCSGGLNALRTAANLALGASFMGRPARILVLSVELSSILARSELDLIHRSQIVRIAPTIFGDGASAAVLSNEVGVPECTRHQGVYEVLGWQTRVIPNSKQAVGFDQYPFGWKVVLTPEVPKVVALAVESSFDDILEVVAGYSGRDSASFDWALHPGGKAVIKGVEASMGLQHEHLRASYDRYENVGNGASAAIMGVMDRLREKDMGRGRDDVLAFAFGPGIAIETMLLKRCRAETTEIS